MDTCVFLHTVSYEQHAVNALYSTNMFHRLSHLQETGLGSSLQSRLVPFPPVTHPSACPHPQMTSGEAHAAVTCRRPPHKPWALRHTPAGAGLPRRPHHCPSVHSGKKKGKNFLLNGQRTANAFRPRRWRRSLPGGRLRERQADPRDVAASAEHGQEVHRFLSPGVTPRRGESRQRHRIPLPCCGCWRNRR